MIQSKTTTPIADPYFLDVMKSYGLNTRRGMYVYEEYFELVQDRIDELLFGYINRN